MLFDLPLEIFDRILYELPLLNDLMNVWLICRRSAQLCSNISESTILHIAYKTYIDEFRCRMFFRPFWINDSCKVYIKREMHTPGTRLSRLNAWFDQREKKPSNI